TSSNARNKAIVQDGRVVVQDVRGRYNANVVAGNSGGQNRDGNDVRGRYNANNQGRPFQRNNARENVVAGNAGNTGGQNRDGNVNPGQAKPVMCYNCKGIGHIARELLDEEQLLFLAGEQVTNFDNDVDDPTEKDLALNVDHIFEADQCDAFDSDVDEALNIQTMFKVNLSSEDPTYDEAGPSYDSNTLFESKKAINEEMVSLEKNQTCSLVRLPARKKALQRLWIFKVKEEQNGKKRYKARLVVKGFQQIRGVDYNEIFSPVVKMTTIRLVLSIIAAENLHLEQSDFKTSFLHGDLDEDIYMTQPEGFQSDGKEENLCAN
ncbi:putative RNA-directed DNA polymerase, partial [Tanacetum coccineum]